MESSRRQILARLAGLAIFGAALKVPLLLEDDEPEATPRKKVAIEPLDEHRLISFSGGA